jgi:glycosyltransferase involved in cell wall biosynthesis
MSLAPGLLMATGRIIVSMRPDVVLGHSLQFQTTPVAAVSARRHGVPFVVTAHIADLRGVPGPIGVAARLHEATVGRSILRVATRAIAVSDVVAAHVRSLAPGLPTDVVPNGVDLARFHAGDPVPHDGLHVGFLGRLVSNKGPDVAVSAVAEAIRLGVDASLFFAGDGPERENLVRLAGRLGIRERVHLQGYVPNPESWFRGIDVLVRPSLTEGMPLGVLEAMAAGVPVIASDVPGNVALLRDGETGLLVPTRDHRALAQALVRIYRDDALRGRLREVALRTVDVLSWDRTTELTQAALERAISGTARRHL